MSIFSNKNKRIYEHRILERYHNGVDGCDLIGETSEFKIYTKIDYPRFDRYFLRQEKKNPKKVVYLGKAYYHIAVLNNTIYTIDYRSLRNNSSHPLFLIDVKTGKREGLLFLSNKKYRVFSRIGNHVHHLDSHSQDVVDNIFIENDTLILEVRRYKESSVVDMYNDDKNSQIEFTYKVLIQHDGTSYAIKRIYPKASNTDDSDSE